MTWLVVSLLALAVGLAVWVGFLLRRPADLAPPPATPLEPVPGPDEQARREERDTAVRQEIRDATDADLVDWANALGGPAPRPPGDGDG